MNPSKTSPPKWPLRFLKWFCKPEYHADIEGDLIELFYDRLENKGKKKAKVQLYKDVILLFRLGIIRSPTLYHPFQASMFKNNLKIAFRNLMKRKVYTLINTLGLVMGIVSSILILLYVQDEYSYDNFFSNSDRIYKMVQERKFPSHSEMQARVPYAYVGILPRDYAEVENATAISGPYQGQTIYVKNENDEKVYFLDNSVILADSNFFTVFSFKMLHGDPKTALRGPNHVVLTESVAKRFFGEENPLGKFISASGKSSIVTGVCEDPPSNSHFQFSYVVSASSVSWFSQAQFNLGTAHCYFQLKKGTDSKSLERKLSKLVDNYLAGEMTKINKVPWEDFKKEGNDIRYFLKPLPALYLDADNLGGFKAGGNQTTTRVLIWVAILIFSIACINFTNLATARSRERAKEVGIRKFLGSFRIQLIFQFLTEAFIVTVFSLLIAILSMQFVLPYFNLLTHKSLGLEFNWINIFIFLSILLLVTALVGIYPSLFLSSFKPVAALKGKFTGQDKGKWVRNGLVVFQFWISVMLIIATWVIQKQVNYFTKKDLGFDKEQLLVIEGTFHKDAHFTRPFIQEISNLPFVEGIATSLWVQGFEKLSSGLYRNPHSDDFEPFACSRVTVGDNFAQVLNMELIAGSFFSDTSDDSLSIVLNESAVKALGLKNPIGHTLSRITPSEDDFVEVDYMIKGVVKDFHYQTLHQKIEPLVVHNNENIYGRMKYIIVKMAKGASLQDLEQIEAQWQALIKERPFKFRFLDTTLDAKYQKEKQVSRIFMLFTCLSIFIACIGLFALSSYTVSQRTKEIGIRKILGANRQDILWLIAKDFTKIVLISFSLAVPVAWYMMDQWLQDFAFRTPITANIFIITGLSILMITWLTISIQSLKASIINPIECLRDE